MKHVVNDSQVAHLWAHWTPDSAQQDARVARNNFYFDGDTIYSYGRHFPIARHAARYEDKPTGKRNPRAILFTRHKNSVTTNGHIRLVRSALQRYTGKDAAGFSFDNRPIFYVNEVKASSPYDHKSNFKDFAEQREGAYRAMGQSRSKAGEFASLYERLTTAANEYSAFFGLRLRLKITPEIQTVLDNAKAGNEAHKALVRDFKRRETAKAEALCLKRAQENKARFDCASAEYPVKLAAWYANEPRAQFPGKPFMDTDGHMGLSFEGPFLRRASPTTIETSKGAEIPYNAGKRLWAQVRAIRSGEAAPYKRNGEVITVGAFAVESIDANGTLIAGCHEFKFEALEDFAKREGWNKTADDFRSIDDLTAHMAHTSGCPVVE